MLLMMVIRCLVGLFGMGVGVVVIVVGGWLFKCRVGSWGMLCWVVVVVVCSCVVLCLCVCSISLFLGD